jgi:hypothetical protein
MLSEHHVSDNYMDMRHTTTPYSQIRLEPEILLLQGLKAFPTSLIAPSRSKMLLVRSPGLQNYPCWTKSQTKEMRKHCIVNYCSDQAKYTDLLSCYKCA